MKQIIYEVNVPMVSAESFDDETIIIHFDTGNYYSLDNFSSIAWKAIENRVDLTSLPGVMMKYFTDTTSEKLQKLLDQLVTELLSEDLIRLSSIDSPGMLSSLPPADVAVDLPENAGCLTKFDDLQELLLLDPIHDVDEMGWPHAQKAEN